MVLQVLFQTHSTVIILLRLCSMHFVHARQHNVQPLAHCYGRPCLSPWFLPAQTRSRGIMSKASRLPLSSLPLVVNQRVLPSCPYPDPCCHGLVRFFSALAARSCLSFARRYDRLSAMVVPHHRGVLSTSTPPWALLSHHATMGTFAHTTMDMLPWTFVFSQVVYRLSPPDIEDLSTSGSSLGVRSLHRNYLLLGSEIFVYANVSRTSTQ